MSTTMLAYRLVDWQRPAQLVEVAVPDPGPGQVRVRVAGCGLCHSDLTMGVMPGAVGEAIGWSIPFTLGHETAGWVDALGPGVSGLTEGVGVALASPSSCGRCRWCQRGMESACPDGLVGRGYGRDGGLAGYVLVDDPQRALIPLGSLDPAVAGPLTDAGATSYHAVRRILPRLGADGAAVVLGVGGLGAFVVQLLVALSDAVVVAVDPDPSRRLLAADLGATHTVDGVGPDTATEVRDLLRSMPVDAVIDLVGVDHTILTGVQLVGPGGALALVGSAGGTLRRPWFGALPRDGEVFTFQGSDLADARAVVELAAAGRVRVDADPFELADVGAAYAALEAGTLNGRAVVRP